MKRSSRNVEDVFYAKFLCLARRLQEVFAKKKTSEEDALRKHLHDVFGWLLGNTYWRHFEDVLQTSWKMRYRYTEDVWENKTSLLGWFVFPCQGLLFFQWRIQKGLWQGWLVTLPKRVKIESTNLSRQILSAFTNKHNFYCSVSSPVKAITLYC